MHRKRSLLLFQKVSSLLRIPLFVPKLRKPIIPKLLLLKRFKKRKDFKLLLHYNNGFHGEYQFSPSSTPLIQFRRKDRVKNRDYRDLCSLLFLVRCLGDFGAEVKGFNSGFAENKLDDALSAPAIRDGEDDLCKPLDSEDTDESVDLRAERFIERFYQEMKLQRQESI